MDLPQFQSTAWAAPTYEVREDSQGTIADVPPRPPADARDRAEGAAFAKDSRTKAPSAGSAFVTATTRGTHTSASAVDTLAMQAALPSRARQSGTAIWPGPVATLNSIRQELVGTAGVTMMSDMAEAGVLRLLGLSAPEASATAAATTPGAYALVAADLASHLIVDRVAGPTMQCPPVTRDEATGGASGGPSPLATPQFNSQQVSSPEQPAADRIVAGPHELDGWTRRSLAYGRLGGPGFRPYAQTT